MQDHFRLTAALVVLMSMGTGRSYAAEPATPKRVVAVKAGRLFDGTANDYRHDVVIVLSGDRIQSVGPPRRRRFPTAPT